jgi:hypothetical protein
MDSMWRSTIFGDQLGRDLPSRQAARHVLQHLGLACGQARNRRPATARTAFPASDADDIAVS